MFTEGEGGGEEGGREGGGRIHKTVPMNQEEGLVHWATCGQGVRQYNLFHVTLPI